MRSKIDLPFPVSEFDGEDDEIMIVVASLALINGCENVARMKLAEHGRS